VREDFIGGYGREGRIELEEFIKKKPRIWRRGMDEIEEDGSEFGIGRRNKLC
jgi:hypothetical protein